MIPEKLCAVCKACYPATRDYFPPHKGLAFNELPCKTCRTKAYRRDDLQRKNKRRAEFRLELFTHTRKTDEYNYNRVARHAKFTPVQGESGNVVLLKKHVYVEMMFKQFPRLLKQNSYAIQRQLINDRVGTFVSESTINNVRKKYLNK